MEIKNFRENNPNSKYLAIFDVYFPQLGLSIREFKIMAKKTGGWFISPPSFSQEKSDGSKEWIPFFTFNEARKKDFYDKLHEMVKEIMNQ